MDATTHSGVMMTYVDHEYLLGKCTVNSFPERTLEVHFNGKQPKEIVQHKNLITKLLVKEALKISSPGLYVHWIYADICIQFYCAGVHLFLLTLYNGDATYFVEVTVIAMIDI